MGRKATKIKVDLTSATLEKLSEVDKVLKDRGSVQHNISDLLEKIVIQAPSHIFDKFVSENTPDEYKFRQLLKDPNEKKRLQDLLKDRSFGMEMNIT